MREDIWHDWLEFRATLAGLALRALAAPLRARRRRRLIDAEMPEGWLDLVDTHLGGVLASIPPDERALYFLHLKVFGLSVRFTGAGGLKLDDHHRVIVAGRAAQMSRNLPLEVWDGLDQVVLYRDEVPRRFRPEEVAGIAMGPTVIMSWRWVEHGLHWNDGYDVTIHELAHVLDNRDLDTDGIPVFERLFHDPQARARFVKVFSEDYRRVLDGGGTALGTYAETSRAEFFAEATVMFFERPAALEALHPELFESLCEYYRCNPLLAAPRASVDPLW